jgi:myo-inositol-1(or 4)-monophosphatase
MSDLSKYLELALEVNNRASEYLESKFGDRKSSNHKSDSHYGIAEDLESNKIYEDFLRDKTPEVALYTEEGERNLESEYVWVVDPIEGTSNYSAGNPFWGTQIGLLHNGEPVIGIVNTPILKQKFTAIKGSGAYLNDKQIHVSPVTEIKRSLVDMVRGTKDEDKDWMIETLAKIIKKIRTNRTFGACGVQISFCAAGYTDIFVSRGANVYDLVPGTIIAREAGASVVNFKGENWNLRDSEYLAGNAALVEEFLKILNE